MCAGRSGFGLMPALLTCGAEVNRNVKVCWGERASAGPANALGRRNGANKVAQAVRGEEHRAVLLAQSTTMELGAGGRGTKQGLGLSVVEQPLLSHLLGTSVICLKFCPVESCVFLKINPEVLCVLLFLCSLQEKKIPTPGTGTSLF